MYPADVRLRVCMPLPPNEGSSPNTETEGGFAAPVKLRMNAASASAAVSRRLLLGWSYTWTEFTKDGPLPWFFGFA